jgi:hypothetical protein
MEQVSQQGNAHVERNQQNILQQAGTLLRSIARSLRLIFFRRHDCGDVLHEVDAAFLAYSAVPLLMLARRANENQRCMAARTKPRSIRRSGAALRAVHPSILESHANKTVFVAAPCTLSVNPEYVVNRQAKKKRAHNGAESEFL